VIFTTRPSTANALNGINAVFYIAPVDLPDQGTTGQRLVAQAAVRRRTSVVEPLLPVNASFGLSHPRRRAADNIGSRRLSKDRVETPFAACNAASLELATTHYFNDRKDRCLPTKAE
jgi:hypothetical protein